MTKEALDRAAELLQEYEWIQGGMARNKKGRVVSPKSKFAKGLDISGAVVRASKELSNGNIDEYRRHKGTSNTKLQDMLRKYSKVRAIGVKEWNDIPGRKKEQAIKLLLLAAKES